MPVPNHPGRWSARCRDGEVGIVTGGICIDQSLGIKERRDASITALKSDKVMGCGILTAAVRKAVSGSERERAGAEHRTHPEQLGTPSASSSSSVQ